MGWDFLDTPITEEGLRAAESKGVWNKLWEEMAFDWDFLNSSGRASRMICRPYSTRCTRMVGSWNNRCKASWIAHLSSTSAQY